MTNDERHKHLDEARHVLESWPMETTVARQAIVDDALDAVRRVILLAEEACELETNDTCADAFECECCGTKVNVGDPMWETPTRGSAACCRGCSESILEDLLS